MNYYTLGKPMTDFKNTHHGCVNCTKSFPTNDEMANKIEGSFSIGRIPPNPPKHPKWRSGWRCNTYAYYKDPRNFVDPRSLSVYNPVSSTCSTEKNLLGAYTSAKKKDLNTTPLNEAFVDGGGLVYQKDFIYDPATYYKQEEQFMRDQYKNSPIHKAKAVKETFLDLRPNSHYGMHLQDGRIYSSPHHMQLTYADYQPTGKITYFG